MHQVVVEQEELVLRIQVILVVLVVQEYQIQLMHVEHLFLLLLLLVVVELQGQEELGLEDLVVAEPVVQVVQQMVLQTLVVVEVETGLVVLKDLVEMVLLLLEHQVLQLYLYLQEQMQLRPTLVETR